VFVHPLNVLPNTGFKVRFKALLNQGVYAITELGDVVDIRLDFFFLRSKIAGTVSVGCFEFAFDCFETIL
jgi:hypothetical protein